MLLAKFKRVLLPLLILALASAAFMGLVKTKPQAPAKPVTEKTWSVRVVQAQPQDYAPSITLFGRVDSPLTTTLSAAVTAFVERLASAEGAQLDAGSLILALDASDVELQVQQREAQLADLQARIDQEQIRHQTDLKTLRIERELLALQRKTVKRYEELASSRAGSQLNADEARQAAYRQELTIAQRERDIADHDNRLAQLKAQLKQAQAQLQQAQLDLERTRVQAPYRARIAKLHVAPGDRVRPGDALATLYNTEALEVHAQLPTRHLTAIRQALADDQTLIAHSNVDGQAIRLQLSRLAGEANSNSGGVDGLFDLVTGGDFLELGRSLKLRLTLPEQPDTVAVPTQALYGTDRLYLVETGRLRQIRIERLGEWIDTEGNIRILVRSPELTENSRVLITQLPSAMTGLKVTVSES